MKHTHTYALKQEMESAGYIFKKLLECNRWAVYDGNTDTEYVYANKSLGDLLSICEKEVGL